jgi:hypothetical protein
LKADRLMYPPESRPQRSGRMLEIS